MMRILPIVEGDGDMDAVPELIRRVAHDKGHFELTICRPHKRGDLPKIRGRFDDYFKTALLEGCPILWVLVATMQRWSLKDLKDKNEYL